MEELQFHWEVWEDLPFIWASVIETFSSSFPKLNSQDSQDSTNQTSSTLTVSSSPFPPVVPFFFTILILITLHPRVARLLSAAFRFTFFFIPSTLPSQVPSSAHHTPSPTNSPIPPLINSSQHRTLKRSNR